MHTYITICLPYKYLHFSCCLELTKITTMLLKATRYIIFLVFFQVSFIIMLKLYYIIIWTRTCKNGPSYIAHFVGFFYKFNNGLRNLDHHFNLEYAVQNTERRNGTCNLHAYAGTAVLIALWKWGVYFNIFPNFLAISESGGVTKSRPIDPFFDVIYLFLNVRFGQKVQVFKFTVFLDAMIYVLDVSFGTFCRELNFFTPFP